MQKILPIIIGIGVIAAAGWYLMSSGAPFGKELFTFTGGDTGRDVVAVVNGKEISRADFEELRSRVAAQQGFDIASLDEETKNQFEAQVVDELVAQTLLRQAVDESGVTAPQEQVDAQVDAAAAQLGGEEAFRQALAEGGLSEEAYRAQLSAELAFQVYLEQELNLSSVSASDEEIEATYAQASAQDEDIPPLEEIRDQVEGFVVQQKQQALLAQLIQKLRAEADIEILI